MTLFEILNFNRELITRLDSVGFRLRDCRFVPLYADYQRLHALGEKTTYIVALLSDRYDVSERKVYDIIRRFGMDCTPCAV